MEAGSPAHSPTNVVRLLALLALMVGLRLGIWFPDVDQRIEFLLHRSIVTHGLILPVVLVAIASLSESRVIRWFTIGFCLSVGVHLAFDLFPRAWTGYALVSVPIHGWISELVSRVWIGGSVITCFYVSMRLAKSPAAATLLIAGLIGISAYAAVGEDALWRPLAAISVAVIVSSVWALGSRRSNATASLIH